MSTGLRQHNLARLRKELSLTQVDFAAILGRSVITIKSIETGRLQLSRNLATLIGATIGTDAEWLLRNDPSEPMPRLERFSGTLEPEAQAYDYTCKVLTDLFVRLFAILHRLKNSEAKSDLLRSIAQHLRFSQAHPEGNPASEPWLEGNAAVFEFFKAHPELLDPDLLKLINLDFLIKDSYLRGRFVAAETRQIVRDLKKLGREEAKPRRRKSPTRNPASRALSDQHKRPQSS